MDTLNAAYTAWLADVNAAWRTLLAGMPRRSSRWQALIHKDTEEQVHNVLWPPAPGQSVPFAIVPRLGPMIHPEDQPKALQALIQRDWWEFLHCAGRDDGLWLVWNNARLLLALDAYEAALLYAFIQLKSNTGRLRLAELHRLFRLADRHKLLAAGQPLPGPGPYTLYRGVAGKGRMRRIRGYSWSASREKAEECARRYQASPWFCDPGVYRLEVPVSWVLAYTNRRDEQEFLVRLPTGVHPQRVA